MSIELFDDQKTCLDQIRAVYRSGKRKPLLVSPTGSGKTFVFSEICRGAARRGSVVWILVHRQELIDQVSDTLRVFGVEHGIISASVKGRTRPRVQVASVFSLKNRMREYAPPDLIIIDEAHHAIPDSTWGKVIAAYPRARLLGVTATPLRLSGEGLGDTFDALVLGSTVEGLIERGRLTRVDVYAPPSIDTRGLETRMGEFITAQVQAAADRPSVTGDAIEHYHRHAPNKRAAIFCVSLEHASHLTSQANAAGISAVMIDGKMDKQIRREIIRDFQADRIRWLVSVDLISEGFDCPGIEAGISLRPTQSLGLWLQQCGRCLRTAPGKSHAVILDHAGNTLRHGLPTEQRDWELAMGRKKARENTEGHLSVRVCPKCFAATASGKVCCRDCGYSFPVAPRVVSKRRGSLEKITPEQAAAIRERQKVGQAKTLQGLIELGRVRGYKNPEGWAAHVVGARRIKRTAS